MHSESGNRRNQLSGRSQEFINLATRRFANTDKAGNDHQDFFVDVLFLTVGRFILQKNCILMRCKLTSALRLTLIMTACTAVHLASGCADAPTSEDLHSWNIKSGNLVIKKSVRWISGQIILIGQVVPTLSGPQEKPSVELPFKSYITTG